MLCFPLSPFPLPSSPDTSPHDYSWNLPSAELPLDILEVSPTLTWGLVSIPQDSSLVGFEPDECTVNRHANQWDLLSAALWMHFFMWNLSKVFVVFHLAGDIANLLLRISITKKKRIIITKSLRELILFCNFLTKSPGKRLKKLSRILSSPKCFIWIKLTWASFKVFSPRPPIVL